MKFFVLPLFLFEKILLDWMEELLNMLLVFDEELKEMALVGD